MLFCWLVFDGCFFVAMCLVVWLSCVVLLLMLRCVCLLRISGLYVWFGSASLMRCLFYIVVLGFILSVAIYFGFLLRGWLFWLLCFCCVCIVVFLLAS